MVSDPGGSPQQSSRAARQRCKAADTQPTNYKCWPTLLLVNICLSYVRSSTLYQNIYYQTAPNVSSGRPFVLLQMFFYSPGYLLAPSADRRETLPHDRNMGVLYNASPKIRGALPQRNWEPKTCKIRRDFRQLQISIANISGVGQDIQNRKTYFSRTIPPAFHEESSVNFGPLTTENQR